MFPTTPTAAVLPVPLSTPQKFYQLLVGNFAGLGDLLLYSGLVLTVIGFMAFATNTKRTHRSQWGVRLFGIGVAFVVVGLQLPKVFRIVRYALGV